MHCNSQVAANGRVCAPSLQRSANGEVDDEHQRKESYSLTAPDYLKILLPLYILTPSTAATCYPSRKIFTKTFILQSSLATK